MYLDYICVLFMFEYANFFDSVCLLEEIDIEFYYDLQFSTLVHIRSLKANVIGLVISIAFHVSLYKCVYKLTIY